MAVWRRKAGDLWPLFDYVLDRLAREGQPLMGSARTRRLYHCAADHPDAMAYMAARQRFGLDGWWSVVMTPEEIDRRRGDVGPRRDHLDAWLLGDPAETSFSSPEELERVLERAIERPAWRDNVSRGIARRVRARYTTDRFARRIVEIVGGSLSGK